MRNFSRGPACLRTRGFYDIEPPVASQHIYLLLSGGLSWGRVAPFVVGDLRHCTWVRLAMCVFARIDVRDQASI